MLKVEKHLATGEGDTKKPQTKDHLHLHQHLQQTVPAGLHPQFRGTSRHCHRWGHCSLQHFSFHHQQLQGMTGWQKHSLLFGEHWHQRVCTFPQVTRAHNSSAAMLPVQKQYIQAHNTESNKHSTKMATQVREEQKHVVTKWCFA